MKSSDLDGFAQSVRVILAEYGRDYALGAVRGLATRNMISVDLPATSPEFYPIVKVHAHALEDLEKIFYSYLESAETVEREDIINKLVEARVWEGT